MKNPSIAAAGVLVALAVIVGGLALASGGDPAAGDADVISPVAAAPKASFESLSPKELRKKAKLEETKRELERIKKVGVEVAPGTYKIVDENGEATFYHGELLPGFGRGGEPMYLTAQFKRLPNVPKKKRKEIPAELQPKIKPPSGKNLQFDKPKDKGGAGGDGTGGQGSGGDGTGTGDQPPQGTGGG